MSLDGVANRLLRRRRDACCLTQLGCNCYAIFVRPLRIYVAATCVLLLLGSQIAGLAHRAFVEHLRCAEHGQLVHGDGHESDAVRRRHGDDVAIEALPAAEAGHEHHHCQQATPARATVARADGPAIDTLRPLRCLAPYSTRCSASEALWRRAPKTSPPA